MTNTILRSEMKDYREILMECHVDKTNTHKYYHFIVPEQDAERFVVHYGRVGKKPNVLNYPISELYTKYHEKVGKGYKTIKTSRWDEDSVAFKSFLEEFLGGGEDCWLPE